VKTFVFEFSFHANVPGLCGIKRELEKAMHARLKRLRPLGLWRTWESDPVVPIAAFNADSGA
jgi:hypothetical protein